MFCRECGKMIQDGNKFCTGCGTKVEPITIKTNLKKENSLPIREDNKQVINPTNNVNNFNNNNPVNNINNNFYQNSKNNINLKDKTSIGYNILAFFVPIAGLILFFCFKNETPKRAKAIGISALVGYILSIIFSILYLAFVFLITFTTFENDRWQNYDYEYNENYDDYKYDFERDYHFNGNYNI